MPNPLEPRETTQTQNGYEESSNILYQKKNQIVVNEICTYFKVPKRLEFENSF